MAIEITNQAELESALQEIWKFHQAVPEFSGSSQDADILLKRHHASGREMTAAALEETFSELRYNGILDPDFSADNRSFAPEPAPEVQVEAPLIDRLADDTRFDDYTVELAPGLSAEDITADKLMDSLSPDTLRQMIARAEQGDTQRQSSLQDEIESLSPSQLRELIFKVQG